MTPQDLRFIVLGNTWPLPGSACARDSVVEALRRGGRAFDAFENPAQLPDRLDPADQPCALLVEDEGDNVERVARHFAERDAWSPFIAFSASAAPFRMGNAMLRGAIDYICLPMSPLDVERAARASLDAWDRFRGLLDEEAPRADAPATTPRAALRPSAAGHTFKSFALHRANLLGTLDPSPFCRFESGTRSRGQ